MRHRGRIAFPSLSAAAVALVLCAVLAGCVAPGTGVADPTSPTGRASVDPGDRLRAAVDALLGSDDRGMFRRLRSLLVSVGDRVLVEDYRGGQAATTTLEIWSVTKSVVATLVGMAVDEGKLSGVTTTLPELLPQHADAMVGAQRGVTLHQLLTMTAGPSTDDSVGPPQPSSDWVSYALRSAADQPSVGQFGYSNADSHVLAAIVARATGQPVLDYARTHLFGPLGIDSHEAGQHVARPEDVAAYQAAPGFAWLTDPSGLQLGAIGLKLTGRDLLKLGQLWLRQGQWAGHQLVSPDWVRRSIEADTVTGDRRAPGYGYQLWVTTAHGHPAFAARGYAGQLVEVVPELDLVVVVQSASPVGVDSPLEPGTAESGDYMDIVDTVLAPSAT
jgi:CubicO group peptidase (beta-lactamase class C family)